MAIFLKYNCIKKIIAGTIIAVFIFPLVFLPKKVLALTNMARVAAAEALVATSETALVEAEGGVAYATGVLGAVVAASAGGTLVSLAVTVPTSDPVQHALTEARYQLEVATEIREVARLGLEIARTELALAQGEKEGFWDAVGWGIAKIALNRLTMSMVEWVRSGYDGSPSFLSRPEAFFRDTANQATGVFISELGANEILCKPWEFGVRFALSFQKPYLIKAECTLIDAVANFENMSENFMAAGWKGFLDITVKQENNPYSAFLQAQSELAVRVGKAEEKQRFDITLGRGFFSVTKTGECITYDLDGNCEKRAPDTIVTPGSYIADSMSFLGMSSVRQAELADELNESLSIIVGEMILQAINPNRGLADIDTVPLEDANRAFSSQTTGRLAEVAAVRINDVTTARDTKDASLALIQTNISPIYTDLITCLNNSSLDATARESEVARVHETETDITADIARAEPLLAILNGWHSELTSANPPSPARLDEITIGLNNVSFPSPSDATAEHNDLVSKRDSAQNALNGCQAALVL